MNSYKRINGFTLIELAVVLVIIGLLAYFALPMSSTLMTGKSRDLTQAKLKNIEAAILNYVVVNRRLPCPADGRLAVTNPLAGIEDTRNAVQSCTNNQAAGVVPYATIGLSAADGQDAWYNMITYRVAYGLTANNALDMSWCDPAGSAAADTHAVMTTYSICKPTCTATTLATNCTSPMNFLSGKGLNIAVDNLATPTLIMDRATYTGAAYVLISHGENTYGAYTPDGMLRTTATVKVQGTALEPPNANAPTATISSAAEPISPFRDAPYLDFIGNPATYFDDLIVHPSLMSLIQKAQLGPRSH